MKASLIAINDKNDNDVKTYYNKMLNEYEIDLMEDSVFLTSKGKYLNQKNSVIISAVNDKKNATKGDN